MKCRHCGAELSKDTTSCPECGKNNIAKWQLIIASVAAVVVLASLAVVLFFGMDLDFLTEKKPALELEPETEETVVEDYVSDTDYTGDKEAIAAALDTVVATVGDQQLTNRVLQYYYNLEVYNFVYTNYSYLSEFGLDYTRPLNNQKCYYDDCSWEVYFVKEAINSWWQYQAVVNLALEDKFTLSKDTKAELEALPDEMKAAAEEAGYDDLDAWMKDVMYADITVDDYMDYCTLMSYYTEYIMVAPSAAELDKYYEENVSYFEQNGVSKEDGASVDVRHILLQPTGETEGEYSEEEWAACLEEAEKVYAMWKSGAANEDYFAELAAKYSTDGGSNTSGGLYSGITSSTNFVEPFLNWCMDENRKVGDTGIVKTDYGYHIMYFSATQELWKVYATEWYAQERELTLADEGAEKWNADINYEAICIDEFSLA